MCHVVLCSVHTTYLSVTGTVSCPTLGKAGCSSSPACAERLQCSVSRLAALSASGCAAESCGQRSSEEKGAVEVVIRDLAQLCSLFERE